MYKRTKIEAEVHPRFLCLEEFMNYTGLGRGSAMKLGKEIGCVMKVGKRALYDTRKADLYFDYMCWQLVYQMTTTW